MAVALLVSNAKKALSKVFTFGAPKIKFDGVNVQGFRIKLRLPITNHTPAPVPVDSYVGDLLLNGTVISSISSSPNATLAANSTTEVGFSGLIKHNDVVNLVEDIQDNGWKENLRTKGVLTVGGFSANVNEALTLF